MAGFGLSDDLIRALVKAAGGASTKEAKKRANSIIKRVAKKNPAQAQTIRSKAGKVSGQMARTKTKRRNMAETTAAAKAHSSRMTAAGKNWDGSKNPRLVAAAKKNKKAAIENAQMAKAYEKAQAGLPPKVKSQQKMFNKADIEAARGTGKVIGKGGKPKPVSPSRAAAARSRAGAINSSLKRRNDAEIKQMAKLQAKLKNATTPAQKLKARRELKQFRYETGR